MTKYSSLYPWSYYDSPALAKKAAEDEIDAMLTYLMEHQNIAPFVAYRLIQRLVTSNPVGVGAVIRSLV